MGPTLMEFGQYGTLETWQGLFVTTVLRYMEKADRDVNLQEAGQHLLPLARVSHVIEGRMAAL